jgi:hypothetical protein
LLLFQQYDRGKKLTDDCVALLNAMDGEPINVEMCEGVMQQVVNVPGGAECVSPLFFALASVFTTSPATRQAYVSTSMMFA